MASFRELAPSHLVKVRGGERGSGWAIGRQGVITARHLVQLFLEKKVGDCWAVLDPSPEGPGFSCSVAYEDEQRDLAVLRVDDDQAEHWLQAIGPGATVLAKPGTQNVAVDAIGFPNATLGEHGVPDPEPISGKLKPAGGALTGRMPLDVDGGVPETSRAWQGMSGAAVSDSSHRLLGVIVEVDPKWQQRRMYVAVLPDPQDDEKFARALRQIGAPAVLEASEAPRARELVSLLDEAGRPYRVDRVPDLGLLGTRLSRTDIDTRGDPFYPYLARDTDHELDTALDARARGADPRLLLLAGVAMAGKSRSLAEALRRQSTLSKWLLVPPLPEADLDKIVELYPENIVLWLDDLEGFLPRLNADRLRRVLARQGVAVAATVRTQLLQDLIRRPEFRSQWDLVNDSKLVQRIDLPTEWTEKEKLPIQDREPVLRDALAAGKPLGEALGSAEEMLRMLQNLSDWQRALADLAADWPRTGIPTPLPEDEAIGLWTAYLTPAAVEAFNDLPDDDRQRRYEAARNELTRPVAREAMTSLVQRRKGGLTADGYWIQHRSQTDAVLPGRVWESALARGAKVDDWGPVWMEIGQQAAIAGNIPIAMKAWQPFAAQGNKETLFNLGLMFERSAKPAAAYFWYDRAAAVGDNMAMTNLGVLLEKDDPVAASWWYQRAAADGDSLAMTMLGRLLEDTDLPAARDWYVAAAAAGDTVAMTQLALLEKGNTAAARDWWQQAAAAGRTDAMVYYAMLLDEDGKTAEAEDWFKRAAAAGDSIAMFHLGRRLEDTDVAAAFDWLKQAAAAGNTTAMVRLGALLFKDGKTAAAQDWWEQAAAAGDPEAMFNLGVLLKESDPVAARDWWQQAAAAGNTTAMVRLGALLFEDGKTAAAQDWWEQAAAAGDPGAMFNLGVLLKESDPVAARDWWQQAAAAGQPNAIAALRPTSND